VERRSKRVDGVDSVLWQAVVRLPELLAELAERLGGVERRERARA
jgi:hypothetical protein